MIEFHPHAEPCHRCHATAWELFGVFKPRRGRLEDVVACAFCGLRTRVPHVELPPPPPAPKNDDAFRFASGRFAGKTLAEADAEQNGRRYLEVMMERDEQLRGMIAEYLAKSPLDSRAHDGEIVAEREQTGATECPENQQSSLPLLGKPKPKGGGRSRSTAAPTN